MATSRTNPFTSRSTGAADQGSRAKAEAAHKQTDAQQKLVDADSWPRGVNGTPMIRAEMAASELIPTGQYANVSVGPARLTFFIDVDREIPDEQTFFSASQRATIAKALNEGAEIVEGDVIAVQRNIVMESMQEQVSTS
jgi:hypothetical protein